MKRCNCCKKDKAIELFLENKRYGYLVLDFIAGETLSEKIKREPISSLYDVKQIIGGAF